MLLFLGLAWAADYTVASSLDLGPPADLEPLDGLVAVATADRVVVVDPFTGTEVDALATGATAILARDMDGDGASDVVACGSTGLWWAPFSGSFGLPVGIDATACELVIAHELDATGLTAVVGDEVWTWDDAGGGSLDGPFVTALSVPGTPLLASRPGALAAASVGDDVLQEHSPFGISYLATGGPVGGLAPSEGEWWVTLPEDELLRDTAGPLYVVGESPSSIHFADVDGDDVLDVLVLRSPQGALTWAAEDLDLMVPVGATDPIVLDDPDVACAAFAVTDGDLISVLRATDCGDLDADGVTVADGDCDDADPSIHPGAREDCDGEDDDCDGEVDEVGAIGLAGIDDVDEGGTVLVYPDGLGCLGDAELRYQVDLTGGATCGQVGDELTCTTWDDGTIAILAEVVLADVVLLAEAESVEIRNVAPDLYAGDEDDVDDFSDGYIDLDAGETRSGHFAAFDPGTDELTYSATSTLPGFQSSPNGQYVISTSSGDDGVWQVSVEVTDGDGGSDAANFVVEVYPVPEQDTDDVDDQGCESDGQSSCGGGGGCFCSSLPVSGMPVLAWVLAVRRWRRSVRR